MRQHDTRRRKIISLIRLDPALRLVWRSGPSWAIASTALMIIQGLLPLAGLYLMKLIIDAVTSGVGAIDPGTALKQTSIYIAMAGGVALAGGLCQSLARYVGEAQAQTVTDHVLDLLHAKSITMDLAYYENPAYFDTLHRAQMEAPFRPTRIQQGIMSLGRNGLSLIAMAGLLASFHPAMLVILVLAAIPGLLVRIRHADKLYAWQQQRTTTERQALYFNYLLTGDQHAKEVRLFGLGPLFRHRFENLRTGLRQERISLAAKRSIAEAAAAACATVAVFSCYVIIAFRTLHGAITIGDLVMYFQAFQRGQQFLKETLANLAGLYEDNLFLANLNEFLALESKIIAPQNPTAVPQPLRHGFHLQHISFCYPDSDRVVLDDISLTIRPGEHLALVGKNGSGKTTLVKLLCRLYDPTAGAIRLDDIDLRQFDPMELRRELSVIFQDFARYNLTARENIGLGDLAQLSELERIITAARQAGAEGCLTTLPHGYDTMLGKWFDGGEELSRGEWQKVALARALMRDAPIIILDEPTSSMDGRAEMELLQRFRRLSRHKTTILISHRLSTIKMADRILVLDEGKLVEDSTHAELIGRQGLYSRLFGAGAEADQRPVD